MTFSLGITGGTGVIGTILQDKLNKRGYKYSSFGGDVTNKVEVSDWVRENDFNAVIHLAAVVATKQVEEDFSYAEKVNVGGTENLLKAIVEKNKKCWFFYASTSHVYKSSENPLKEDDEIAPVSLYGKTKYLGEQKARTAAEAYPMIIDLCIGRIFSFYHDTQKPPFLYPNIMNRLAAEDLSKEFVLYGADSVRDFLNAEEVVEYIILMMEKHLVGTFNIGSGKEIKIRDFVQSLTDQKLIIKPAGEKTDYLVADISKLDDGLKN